MKCIGWNEGSFKYHTDKQKHNTDLEVYTYSCAATMVANSSAEDILTVEVKLVTFVILRSSLKAVSTPLLLVY